MNRNDPRLEERTDASHRIGIDACGLAHYFDAQLGVVWTTTALNDVAHVLTVDSLDEWHAFVADDRGWQTHSVAQCSLAETIATACEEAL
jgi:hypothetical protein